MFESFFFCILHHFDAFEDLKILLTIIIKRTLLFRCASTSYRYKCSRRKKIGRFLYIFYFYSKVYSSVFVPFKVNRYFVTVHIFNNDFKQNIAKREKKTLEVSDRNSPIIIIPK